MPFAASYLTLDGGNAIYQGLFNFKRGLTLMELLPVSVACVNLELRLYLEDGCVRIMKESIKKARDSRFIDRHDCRVIVSSL